MAGLSSSPVLRHHATPLGSPVRRENLAAEEARLELARRRLGREKALAHEDERLREVSLERRVASARAASRERHHTATEMERINALEEELALERQISRSSERRAFEDEEFAAELGERRRLEREEAELERRERLLEESDLSRRERLIEEEEIANLRARRRAARQLHEEEELAERESEAALARERQLAREKRLQHERDEELVEELEYERRRERDKELEREERFEEELHTDRIRALMRERAVDRDEAIRLAESEWRYGRRSPFHMRDMGRHLPDIEPRHHHHHDLHHHERPHHIYDMGGKEVGCV